MRAKYQYQDEQDKGPDVLPGAATELAGDVLGGHRLDDTQDQATDDGLTQPPGGVDDDLVAPAAAVRAAFWSTPAVRCMSLTWASPTAASSSAGFCANAWV